MFITQRLFPFVLISFLSVLSPASASDLMEGVEYERITPAQPTSAPEGKIEVAEWFWYGCPHCFRFEPHVEAWLKQKPDHIVFKRVPAALNPKWAVHARVYYAAEILGLTEKVHKPLFYAMHVEKKRLYNEEALLDFIEGLGIDRKKFSSTMRSFAVSSKIRRSQKLGKAYNLRGVPAMVINGKYKTSGSLAGGLPDMLRVSQQLADRELVSKTASAQVDSKPAKQ